MAGLVKVDWANKIYSSEPTDLFCVLLRGNRLGEALSVVLKKMNSPYLTPCVKETFFGRQDTVFIFLKLLCKHHTQKYGTH